MQHDAFPNPLGRVDAAAHQGLDPLTWHESLQMKVMQNVALAVCKQNRTVWTNVEVVPSGLVTVSTALWVAWPPRGASDSERRGLWSMLLGLLTLGSLCGQHVLHQPAVPQLDPRKGIAFSVVLTMVCS